MPRPVPKSARAAERGTGATGQRDRTQANIAWFIRNQLEIELDLVLEQIEDISADADQNAEDIAKAG